jgi:uncharacterized protein YbjQ (UPF0145 family)
MIVTTTETLPDQKIIETIGLVRGNTIRARHLGKDIFAAFKNIVGGEISEYTKLMAESREQSLDRLRDEATRLAEILAYGTAVKIERD